MTRNGLSSAWNFARDPVLLRWPVFPLLALATLASLLGLLILPANVVAAVVVYYVAVVAGAMAVGLGAEWLLRLSLDSDEGCAYY
ncbi:hypothetical protein [Haloarchaeobius salinus]|uniref:hypothetical protein n=1 Tax=Haloarchaeobius salinus TaxID=1198298 RepID=UPI00210DFE11|nr:hypothetical protein [Haloarchaeobius salinus]